jgi:TolA-binding protein
MKSVILPSLLCLTFCFIAPHSAPAQTIAGVAAETGDSQTLRLLLIEVRQLRQLLQRANLNSYRTQVLIERLRVQQGRVDRLLGELEQLRLEALDEKMSEPNIAEFTREQENQISREPDPTRRSEMEAVYKSLKNQIAQREQQRRERETELTIRLQTEQARLNELNDRLDALERELETPRK